MTDETRHLHVSERLPEYVRGRLDAAEAKSVDEHLVGCSECREELTGLRALLGAEVIELTEVERDHLHAAVAEALDPTEAPAEDSFGVWLPPRKSGWSRFAPTLGAAALLLIAVIGALNVESLGGGDDGGEESSLQMKDAPGKGDEKAARPAPRRAPAEDSSEEGTGSGDTSTAGGSENKEFAQFALEGPQPRFLSGRAARTLDAELLEAGGKTGERDLGDLVPHDRFASFAKSYTVADARRLEASYMDRLGDQAPKSVDKKVRQCGHRVLGYLEEPLLPAYGTVTEFDARETLLLGFVYSTKSHGKLSNYMLWSWPDQCTDQFRFVQGTIRK